MIEVLVAMFVLSLGVIGAVGMQLTALRTAQQSAFQTAALQLATEMAERIRANPELARPDGQPGALFPFHYQSAQDGEPPAPEKSCHVEQCSSLELAGFDLYEWKKRIRAALPGGRAAICRDASAPDAATATLDWKCSDGKAFPGALVIKLGWHDKTARAPAEPGHAASAAPGIVLVVGS